MMNCDESKIDITCIFTKPIVTKWYNKKQYKYIILNIRI